MLKPGQRLLYSELLTPPPGFRLEKGVGTTFSADLVTLLLMPLSLAQRSLQEAEPVLAANEDAAADGESAGREAASSSDEAASLPTSMGWFQALRQHMDRLVLFCQRGHIAVPRNQTALLAYLDDMVVEVNPDATFHPKLWLLHYTGEDGDHYRLICGSRNVTFDRSWDTMLSLEGRRDGKSEAGEGEALTAFLSDLLEVVALDADRAALVEAFRDELSGIHFTPPENFQSLSFHYQGYGGPDLIEQMEPCRRLMVVSPFLTGGTVIRLGQLVPGGDSDEPRAWLVSRPEALNDVGQEQLAGFEVRAFDEPGSEGLDDEEERLEGLHAKLYLCERGSRVTWWLGSPNATQPGLEGSNVEFAVALEGSVGKVGIDRLLDEGDEEEPGLGRMLVPYLPVPRDDVDADAREAERRAESLRQYLSDLSWQIDVDARDGGRETNLYHVTIRLQQQPDGPVPVVPVEAQIWPVGARKERWQQDLLPLLDRGYMSLGDLPLRAITGFLAFQITAMAGETTRTLRFVLKARLTGMPERRYELLLQDLIQSPDRFLRYLRFLLSEEPEYWQIPFGEDEKSRTYDGRGRGYGPGGLPLVERLLDQCVEGEVKLREVHDFVHTVWRGDEGGKVIPQGFLEDVWLPVLAALKPEWQEVYRDGPS